MARKHDTPIPRWIKLDNAAKIYPPSRSRNWAAMFRLSVTLNEPIDISLLEKAQAAALRRMPTFAYALRRGVFWYYLEHVEGAPLIQKDVANPMVRMLFDENKNFMFRTRYYENRIAVEFFHALTDGTGGLIFLLTMTAEYLRLKYGAHILPNDRVWDMRSPVMQEEMEDSFLKYARSASLGRRESAAYRVPGTPCDLHCLNIITGIIPIRALSDSAKQYGVSVTTLIASVLIQEILKIQRADPSKIKRRRMVKVSIPVNLRPYYQAVTLRNFASYVNVGVMSTLGEYTLEEIINQVRHQMGMEITEKRMNARFSGNVNSEKHPAVRGMPLFLKAPFLKMMYLLQGDRYISVTLSNLGAVRLPEDMQCYVRQLDFILGPSRGKSINLAVIGCGDSIYLNFSRVTHEPILERGFFTALVKMGIPVKIESNLR